jgi:tight adherence protein B
MRRITLLTTAALLAACYLCAAATAAIRVTPANSVFPQRALLISEPGVTSLSPKSVQITENGVRVNRITVRSLRHASSNDFGIVLVIDISPTASAVEHAVVAARALAAQRPAQGMLGIVEADATPPVALGLTRDPNAINQQLAAVPKITHHGLNLYGATLAGLGLLRTASIAAGSVIVVSDGADKGDQTALQQIVALARGSHIAIYTVGIKSSRFSPKVLSEMSGLTGGQLFESGSSQLGGIFTSLESKLSTQFLIRYRSSQGPGQRIAASMRIAGVPGAFDISYTSPGVNTSGASRPTTRSHFWTSTGAVVLLSLLCAFLVGFAAMTVITRRRGVSTRVRSFIAGRDVTSNGDHKTLAQRALGDPRRRRRLSTSGRLGDLLLEIDIGRIQIAPDRIVWLTLAATVLVGWLLVAATGSPAAALIALAVPFAVRFLIRTLASRQRREFDEQLPDNLQIVASAMRAGHTFAGGLAVVVDDAPEPSKRELSRALSDEQLGVPLVEALEGVSTRMQSKDFEHVVLVARMHRDTGGNTAEVLDLVTETIRERIDLRRLVRALTAQGRLAGGVVSILPVVLLLGVALINPHYLRPLFHTTAGIVFLVLGVVMMITGALIIRRIVDIEV